MTTRQGFEAFEVFGQVPEEGVAAADEAVLVVGYNEGEHSGQKELNRHGPRNMRMGIITVQSNVIVREVKQGLDLRIQPKGGKCARLAADLKFNLIDVVAVNMRVAQGVHKVANSEAQITRHKVH